MEDQKLKVGYADNKSSSITNEVYKLDPSFKSSAKQLSQQQKKSLQQSSNTSDIMNKPESSSRSSSGMNEEQLLDVLLTLQVIQVINIQLKDFGFKISITHFSSFFP